MTRALQTLALALLLIGLGHRPASAGKPTVVILGLEVINSQMDPTTTQLAHDFTVALRGKANNAGQLVPHAEKELVDEKLIRNCNNAEALCLAPIGADLSATYVIYGSFEKNGTMYKISLHMITVAIQKANKHCPTTTIGTAAGIDTAAGKAWTCLMGDDTGSININVQNDGVDRGDVYVNRTKVAQLQGGHATIKDLSPDRYTIWIESTGFQRFEQTVSVGQGEHKDLPATLTPVPGSKVVTPPVCPEGSTDCGNTVSHPNSHTGYKVVGYSALVLAAAAGGYALYLFSPQKDYEKNGPAPFIGGSGSMTQQSLTSSDCGMTDVRKDTRNGAFDKACSAKSNQVISGIAGGVLAGVAIGALILAYRSDDSGSEKHAQMGHRKSTKPLIAVTPIISPDGGGATVRIDF